MAGPSTKRFRGITKEEEEEYGKLKQWFTHNQDEWEELRAKWKATSHIRRLEFSKQQNLSCTSIIELYPTLKNHLGYQLIQADFKHQFPEKAACLFDRWDTFCCGIVKVFQLEISDPEGKALLKTLEDSNISVDAKNVTIIALLCHLLACKHPIGKTKKSGAWKPSIAETKDTVCVVVADFAELQDELARVSARFVEIAPIP